ncbi:MULTISPECIES: ABC transporter permease [Pseudomonas]|uniref:ABC transporter permease n=1 Tax=Pseudomonas TaxID=286 RepID=UPI000D3377A0|nr:ABC transporter permease [Pseudomonas putida]PTV64958.1 ABC transporter permease [Pseudomonas putida]
MQNYSVSPLEMIKSLWRNKLLIVQLSKREVLDRYRGSVLGLSWSFFNPVLMLIIYTFVFSVVFKARWGGNPEESKSDFAIILYIGLILHGLFAECINRSPNLITSNVSYVKKVVFPLEILPWAALLSSLFHAFINFLVLLIAMFLLNQSVPLTAALFPLVILPLILGTLGFSWFIAALGVYLRDVSQVTNMITTILLFMSGVFFPITALPVAYHEWLRLNPLATIIEQSRNVLIFGHSPDLTALAYLYALGLLTAICGFAWFQKTRKGFADVL